MKRTMVILVLASLAAACGSRARNAPQSRSQMTAVAPRHATAAPNGGPKLPPGHPPIDSQADPAPTDASLVVSGKVVETMNAGGYTYVRVGTAHGDVWAAVPQANLQVGAPVTVNGQLVMENFESKTLKRSFDRIIFGTIAGADSPIPAEPSTSTDMSTA